MSAGAGFVKLYGSILTSSVWVEPHHIFRVWITFLVLADKNGYVAGTVPGIASIARVTIDECDEAIATFLSPDAHSRTTDEEGRRIEIDSGGWTILNHAKYRELRTDSQIAAAERQRRFKERHPPLPAVTGNASNAPEYRVQSTESREVLTTSSLSHAREGIETESPNGQQPLARSAPPWPEPVMAFLSRRGEQLVAWTSSFMAMLQGVGTPAGKAVTTEQIAQACIEIETLGGAITPRRFRRVLEQVMEPPGSPRRNGQAGSDDAEFVAASNRLQEIATYRDPVRSQSLSAEGWKTVTPTERAALKAIGTVERVLTARPDQWPFVVRDFQKALRGGAR